MLQEMEDQLAQAELIERLENDYDDQDLGSEDDDEPSSYDIARTREMEFREVKIRKVQRREAERGEAERRETERREAEIREAERPEAERREAERREEERQKAEQRKQNQNERDAEAAIPESVRQETETRQRDELFNQNVSLGGSIFDDINDQQRLCDAQKGIHDF